MKRLSFLIALLLPVAARAAILFPAGDALNTPMIADPWEIRTAASSFFGKTADGYDHNTQVEVGNRFGLVQGLWGTVKVQAGIGGDIRSRFQFFDPTVGGNGNLVNDYTVSLPIDFREADDSVRVEFYHTSSHLGDGFSAPRFAAQTNGLAPQRYMKNAMKITTFYGRKDHLGLRLYWGGEVSDRPENAIGQHAAHLGGEWLTPVSPRCKFFAALDSQWLGEVGWKNSMRGTGGFRIEGEKQRYMEFFGGYTRGNAVQKRFYQARESFGEAGVRLGF